MTPAPTAPPPTVPDPSQPSKAIGEAFAGPARAVLEAADLLAGRIAAGTLSKADTPEAIKAVFEAAGFEGEEAATAEVQRHTEILAARDSLAAAGRAHAEIKGIDARREKLLAELESTTKRITGQLQDLLESRREPDLRVSHERAATRDLRERLLPGGITLQLATIRHQLNALAPDIQRLEQLPQFRPATVAEDFLGSSATKSRRQAASDRLDRVNAEGLRQHDALIRRLEARKQEAEGLHRRVEQLRGRYLP